MDITKGLDGKQEEIVLLSATYVKQGDVYIGWIKEDSACISQSDSIEDLKKDLLNVLRVKNCAERIREVKT